MKNFFSEEMRRNPYPLYDQMRIAEVIGITAADRPRFKRWSDVILGSATTSSATKRELGRSGTTAW